MREDMAELLLDMPRSGSRFAQGVKTRMKIDPSPYLDLEDPEYGDIPLRIGRRARHYNGWSAKEQSDYLSPLYNFLEKSVGRYWDDIYSEIRAVASKDSLVGFHLLQHVHMYVDRGDHKHYSSFHIDDEGILCKRKDYWSNYNNLTFGPIHKIEFSDELHFELRRHRRNGGRRAAAGATL